MTKENIKFGPGASHYCKYCHAWGNPMTNDITDTHCSSCGMAGYLMPNPFPDDMVPYVELPE